MLLNVLSKTCKFHLLKVEVAYCCAIATSEVGQPKVTVTIISNFSMAVCSQSKGPEKHKSKEGREQHKKRRDMHCMSQPIINTRALLNELDFA
jgi:hypothetical protein